MTNKSSELVLTDAELVYSVKEGRGKRDKKQNNDVVSIESPPRMKRLLSDL